MRPEVKVWSPSRDVTVASYRNVLFVHFREQTPPGCVAAWEAAQAAIEKSGQKSVFLGVIEPASVTPDDACRRAFTKFFEDHANAVACFSIAYQREGFRGAAARAAVTAIMTVLPRFRFPFPRTVVETLDEAAAFVAKSAPGLVAGDVVDAFRELRRMEEQGAPPR